MKRQIFLLHLLALICLIQAQKEEKKENEDFLVQTEMFTLPDQFRTLNVTVQMNYKKELQGELRKLEQNMKNAFQEILSKSMISFNGISNETQINVRWTQNENSIELITDLTKTLEISAGNIEFDDHLNMIRNEKVPENCQEAMSNETNLDGVYVLKIRNTKLEAFGAYCKRFNDSGWTIIQRRQDGYVQFFTNWTDYKYGFGDLNAEYWLGLERLHAMTSARNYELWVQLESYTGQKRFARYSQFVVAGQSENYMLTVSGYSGDAGDSLRDSNGDLFATLDKPNGQGCVRKSKSGWWHSCPTWTNLNGEYLSFSGRMTENDDFSAIYWYPWLGVHESLKYTHMALRPL